MGDVLLLHRGVHHSLSELAGPCRPQPNRARQALLQQRLHLLLADALTPACQPDAGSDDLAGVAAGETAEDTLRR